MAVENIRRQVRGRFEEVLRGLQTEEAVRLVHFLRVRRPPLDLEPFAFDADGRAELDLFPRFRAAVGIELAGCDEVFDGESCGVRVGGLLGREGYG